MHWTHRRYWELIDKRHGEWPINLFLIDMRLSASARLKAALARLEAKHNDTK